MWTAPALLCGVCVLLTVTRTSCGRTSEHLYNVSQTIVALLDDYDMRLRPNFGGEPCYIGMDITIASFDSISEVNMDYTITMYLNQYWKDERLAFSSDDEVLTLPGDFAENIWVPDTFFANDKSSYLHDVTEKNKMVRLHGDGSITYGMRFTTTLACMMDLHHYPLDVQNCTVEIESYGYTLLDVVMYWKEEFPGPVVGVNESELAQFTIMDHNTDYRTEHLATGSYRRLTLSFLLARNIGYFIFQTYLPSILIVMLSWVSFWINHEATSARVALGITTVLTMTTISTGVRSSLPRISYVKAIDIYLVMCFVFVFAALLEYAAVNYTFWGQKAKKKPKEKPAPPPKPPAPETPAGKPGPGKADGVPPSEEIIELQDIRMSPIPSIRQRHNSKFFSSQSSLHELKFPPSFRINRNYLSRSMSISQKHQSSKRKIITTLKKKASEIKTKIPSIQDVNIIDKYSRVVFPFSFMLFNLGYWGYYKTVDGNPGSSGGH